MTYSDLPHDDELPFEEVRATLTKMQFTDEELLQEQIVGGSGSKTFVVLVAAFAALGGFLFGLDLGYISGVESMASFSQDVLSGEEIESLEKGTVTGIFAIGAVVAAFPAVISCIVDRVGRKGCMVLGGLTFCLGAAIQGWAPNLNTMLCGRFIAGASVGLLSANVPLYQGEIAPPENRGAIVALYQLAITMGIMLAFWMNYWLQPLQHGWRYSILLQLIPGGIFAAGASFMPQSPRWLVSRRRYKAALDILRRIRGKHEDVRMELVATYKEYRRERATGKANYVELFTGSNGKVLLIGIVLQLLQQLCGLNVFMYYGPTVFKKIFHAPRASFLFAALSGLVNFLSTFPALCLVDRLGRTTLLCASALGMAICCSILAAVGDACFSSSQDDSCGPVSKYAMAGAIFLDIFNYAYGWGPVVWIYCAEIFSLKYKTKSNGLTTDANWVGNFLIGFAPPWLMEKIGFKTFWIFAAVNLLGVALSCVLPETKGKSLEEIQELFHSWLHKGEELPGDLFLCADESDEGDVSESDSSSDL
ncbi:unnamed protein product [Durusdinium trenchii]|uniref:Hexose transporter 1 n=1 Tax=Durusdinium trenchii TaxID=1381693 RepID=A0ABP0JN93_9DINO